MSDSDEGPSWSASDAEGNEARDSDDGEDNGPRDDLGLAQVHDEGPFFFSSLLFVCSVDLGDMLWWTGCN